MVPRTPRKLTRAELADRPNVSVYFDRAKELWHAEIRLRQDPHTGRWQVKKVSSKNKNTLYEKLSKALEAVDQGVNSPARYTVADCVAEFLREQLDDAVTSTRDNYTVLAKTHITPYLGRHLLAQLRVADVLAWLRGRKKHLSSRTLRLMLSACWSAPSATHKSKRWSPATSPSSPVWTNEAGSRVTGPGGPPSP